jgi:hypothetical protein
VNIMIGNVKNAIHGLFCHRASCRPSRHHP